MKCEEVQRHLSALVLDELDIEVRDEMRRHLEGCVACRSERTPYVRTMKTLETMGIETSGRRRETAVAAMVEARNELVERAILRRPSRWPLRIVGIAAAALLIFSISYVSLLPELTWRIVAVRGTVRLTRGEQSSTVVLNDRLRAGDIVSLLHDGALTLEGAEGKIELASVSSLEVRARGQVLLMDGSVRVEARGEVTVVNRWNDRVVLRNGMASVVSDLRALAPSAVDRDSEPPKVSGDRLRVRVDRGQAVLRGSTGELMLEAGETGKIDERSRPTSGR